MSVFFVVFNYYFFYAEIKKYIHKGIVMKIKAWSLGVAGGITFCIMYTALAIALKLYPSHTLKFIGMIHMMPKLEYIKHFIEITPQAIALGMIFHTIAVFFFFWFMSTIYNLFQK